MTMMSDLKQLSGEILFLDLKESQLDSFSLFYDLLQFWNTRYNLTTITDRQEILIKHFIDSLSCLRVISDSVQFSLIDIGTGAGFPGIPLRIMVPGISLTLVESVKKKAEFCKLAVKELGLDNVEILHSRAEDIGQAPDFREKYDWSVARAVADLSVLAEYLLPLVKVGGHALAMKSANCEEELSLAKPAIKLLGGRVERIEKINLPENYGARSLIVIEKSRQTPEKYPRRAGIPAKKPLL